ncbi:hypothetical protein R3P38DRAFT_2803517 [Favolaschia claudopus]|uniref:Uncharacterized protein n=1 Tax=Favolaschia claudopus TaxID=2862362 RepID=A0AAV9ZSV5_9AGAR
MPNNPSARRDENDPPHRSKKQDRPALPLIGRLFKMLITTMTRVVLMQETTMLLAFTGSKVHFLFSVLNFISHCLDELARSKAEQSPAPENAGDESTPLVPQPQNISEVKMEDLRQELGFNKPRWNAFRSCVRHSVIAARLDWDKNWKAQDDKKKLRAINVVRADFPEVKRFENAWAIKRVTAEYWGNRKTYGRPATSSAAQRRPRPSDSDDDQEDDLFHFSDDNSDGEQVNGEPAAKRVHRS